MIMCQIDFHSSLIDLFLHVHSLLENSDFTRAKFNTDLMLLCIWKVWAVYFRCSFTTCIRQYWCNVPSREGWCWRIQGRGNITLTLQSSLKIMKHYMVRRKSGIKQSFHSLILSDNYVTMKGRIPRALRIGICRVVWVRIVIKYAKTKRC